MDKMSNSIGVARKGKFKLLFTNSRAKMPADYSAPLSLKTSREMIGDRIRETADKPKQA